MRARQCLWRTMLILLVGSVLPLSPRLGAAPFTYQGRLLDGAFPANGAYELRFRLFDSLAGGSAVGGELVLNPVVVTNGLFAVSLDFGTGVFTGADRFLEMSAKISGDPGAVSTISPRQTITAVPYALFAFSGSGDAGALTTGTLSDARLSGNIARTLDVLGVSNVFEGRLSATNTAIQGQLDALTARLDQLTTALTAVSNQVASGIPQGTVLASVDASDASLVGQGFNRFAKLEASGWKNGGAAGAPGARTGHSAVWTGTRLLVWGGTVSGQPASTGGSYDPVADTWSSTSPIDPPAARTGHIAVWTGSRLLIWGGFAGGYLGDGSSYDPTGLSWAPLGSSGAPVARDGHGGIWTGSRLVLWGGRNTGGLLSDGAVFDLVSNAWTALPTSGEPAARQLATVTWAADRLIVFGGEGAGGELDTGAMLPFTSGITPGAWQSLATLNAPGARVGHTAVWTGTRLLVWGGKRAGAPLADGASLDPVSNAWTPLPTLDAPGARSGHEAVWTGSEMVLFGGEDASGPLATGAAYNPSTGRWRALADGGAPLARTQGTGIWTGSELLVFGGINSYTPSTPIASLQRLNPQPTWYLFRKP